MTPLTIQQAFDLAQQHQSAGRFAEAEHLYRRILAQRPKDAKALHFLGVTAYQTGRSAVAAELIRQAISLQPNYVSAHINLGNALGDLGQFEDAIAAYRKAIALNPTIPDAYSNLGVVLKQTGQADEAITACRQAIALRPGYADAHNNLGLALKEKGLLDEAIAAYRQALGLKPGLFATLNNLGNALKDSGQIEEAIAVLRQAMASHPNFPQGHSNLIYTMHFHADIDAAQLAEEHRRWNRQHATPLRAQWPVRFDNDTDPERRLRIGYVSPDYRDHPAGRFFLTLLENHNRGNFEFFCYSNMSCPDWVTQRIRSRSDVWRNIVGISDENVAAMIRQDKIDILVDLAMHTAGNRLLVFARKPAPVQVTYLAYCSSTGLDAIDYRFTDQNLDPVGETDHFYSEKSIRLPDVYWCFDPGPGTPDLAPLPALAAGHVTFGCLNNFAKASPAAISTWIAILKALPSSRFLLHARQGEHRRKTLARFQAEDVDPNRLTFVDYLSGGEYMGQYHLIDIALDPFPYAGGTTTCEALWMGVPVVTLAGRTAVGRSGVTLLSSVGLNDLVAKTPQQYVRLAVELASDPPRLAQLRAGLRERMLRSPLTDAPKFARNIEAAYRQMWRFFAERKMEQRV